MASFADVYETLRFESMAMKGFHATCRMRFQEATDADQSGSRVKMRVLLWRGANEEKRESG